MTRPNPSSIDCHVLKDIEPVPNTNDLWLAQATRSVKNPGKGHYQTVLLGPHVDHGDDRPFHMTLAAPGEYRLRGFLKEDGNRFKVWVHSPQWNDPSWIWIQAHSGLVYAQDHATARRILIMLARELVYDRS
jgi:hypothetical protein